MPEATLTFDRGTLLLEPSTLPEELVPTGFVRDLRAGGRFRAPASTYRRAVAHLVRAGVALTDAARGYRELDLRMTCRREAFPYQSEALAAWEQASRRGLVALPTGAGKTFVAELAVAAARRSTLVIVPTLDLVAQWARRLGLTFGVEIGMLGGGTNEVRDITVTTYDSAYLHMDRLGGRFGLLVFDEAHHLPSDAYAQAAELAIAPFRLGLTATPERADGLHVRLDDLCGPIVYRRSVSELRGEYLADYDVVRIEVDLRPEERARHDAARAEYRRFVKDQGIKMGGPTGWQRFIEATSRSTVGRSAFRAYQEQRRIALASESKLAVLEELFREHRDDKMVFFAHDNRTVHEISTRWLVPVITHETEVAERRRLLLGLDEGRWRVLGTSRVLNEGVDMPDVSVGVVLSGSGSVREHVQRLGRILRRGSGKHATLYELVTADTVDAFTSERRRDHEAYDAGQGGRPPWRTPEGPC